MSNDNVFPDNNNNYLPEFEINKFNSDIYNEFITDIQYNLDYQHTLNLTEQENNDDNDDNDSILDNVTSICSSSSSTIESLSSINSIGSPPTMENISLNNKSKTTSVVWNFMHKKYNSQNDVIEIVCSLCEKKYAKKTSTRPLMDHLTKEHSNILSTTNQLQKPYNNNDSKRIKECTDAVINFIVGFQMPFSVVGNFWFRKLCNIFDSRYILPTRQSLQNQIHQRFENHRNLIAKELSELTVKVSLTADIWTSISNQAYLGITIHYINNNWKLCRYLLDLIHLVHEHTAMRIKEKLFQLIYEMNLNDKVLALTTDNDAKMISCGNLMLYEFEETCEHCDFHHYRCAAHILNLAVNHGMELRAPIIDKVRKFVNKIRNSTKFCDELRDYCKEMKKNYCKPDLDVATRWNSTFLMLEKFKHMREELNCLVNNNKKTLEPIYLNNNEWEEVQSMIILLDPMYKATKMLSSSSYPTISDIRLTFIGIFRHIELFIENQNHSIEKCMMADSISKKLKDYWTIIDKSTIISTLLDPCSKLLTFSSEENKNQAINILRSKMNNYASKLNNSNSENNILKSSGTRLFFENLITQQNNQVNQARPIEDELERYLALPSISSDSLLWWSQYEDKFPVLSKIAQEYLAIQGTSVPCEQAFSMAAHTISKVCNRLNPSTARAILCLKSWIDHEARML